MTKKAILSMIPFLTCNVFILSVLHVSEKSAYSQGNIQVEAKRVIAILQGKPVIYKQVALNDQQVKQAYALRFGQDASTLKKDAFERQKTEMEAQKLANVIRKMSHQILVKRFKVSVTSQDVAKALKALNQNNEFGDGAEELRRKSSILLSAIDMVYIQNIDKGTAYTRVLSKEMSKAEWELNLAFYKDSNNRASLKRMASATVSDFEKSLQRSTLSDLEADEVAKKIDALISIRDAQFLQYTRIPTNSRTSETSSYIEKQRSKWWETFYKSALTLSDKKYGRVYTYLMPERSQPQGSVSILTKSS